MDDEEWTDYDGGAVQELHQSARRIRVDVDVAVISEYAFAQFPNLRVVDLSNVSTISAGAFFDCQSLERVVRSAASEVEIDESAFAHCGGLREIDLSNVTIIGERAFEYCGALARVTIPSSVAVIGDSAFYGCTSLAEVDLCEGIQRIRVGAFEGCKAMRRINIPASVTHIGFKAFEADVFEEHSNLLEVVLNEGLQCIGERAFSNTSLIRISIPSTVSVVGGYAFCGCGNLVEVELNDGVQVIGASAFQYCPSLECIAIPSSVRLVGTEAFADCLNLAEVTLNEGAHHVVGDAFDGDSLGQINIPPVAFVIDVGVGGSCQLLRGTMPVQRWRTLVMSKWMQYRGPGQLERAEAKINEIRGRHHLRQREDEKMRCIREWFAYYDRLDVTTILELAIWKSNMGGNEQDMEARKETRRSCGSEMNVIIPGVLPFLDPRD